MSTKKIQILNGASIIPKPDWNQTDDTKADYIKNRPFYEDTLVNITWDGDTIGKTEVNLTSVLGFNVYLVSDYAPSVEDLTGSTVTVYDGSSSMEFSVKSVQTPSDNIIIVLDGYAFVILADNSEFNGIVFPSKGTYFANGGETYVSRITKKVINQIDPKFINMDSFPKELLKITVTSSDSTYSADKTDSDIKSCLDNGGIPYIALYDTVFIYEGYSSDIGYMFIDTNDGKMLCIYNNSVSLYSSNLKSKLDSTVSTTAQTLTDEQKTQARTNIGGADISLGISGATAGQMAKVKAVNASGAPTAWEAGDAAGGGSEWTKLGDVTVSQTAEFVPLSFSNGIVTIDTNADGYASLPSSGTIGCIVHTIDVTSKANPVVGMLKPKNYEAGTFEFYNRDSVFQSSAAYDPTTYKISIGNVAMVVLENIPTDYKRYKSRMTTPVYSNHGLRQRYTCEGFTEIGYGADSTTNMGGGAIIETEFYPHPYDENYVYRRVRTAYGKFYGGGSGNEFQSFELISSGSGKTKPQESGIISFRVSSMIFVNGTRFELWGTNDD